MLETLKMMEHALANFAEAHGLHLAEDYERARTALVQVRGLIAETENRLLGDQQPGAEQQPGAGQQPVADQLEGVDHGDA